MNFQELGLMPLITEALRKQGYEQPTPIQQGAIPPALAGRDVLGCAQTGTGKTCAFATPILQRLAQNPKKGPRAIRALILTPTRELALQIQESFVEYGRGLPLRSAVIFGGVGQQPQVDAIRRGLDILAATPGRLLDLHGQGFLDFSSIEIFVLDEADRMLDMGFIHDVRRVLKVLPKKKQTLFFSATMPPEVTDLVNALLTDPARVAVDPISSPVEVIQQSLYYVDKGNKTALLASLVNEPEVQSALVFTRTKHRANKVAGELERFNIAAAAIHGNKSQTARQKALADFKAGRVKVLVATDIAARGIDIDELSHVFNYNLPDVAETYVHRIGRTGRAGHGGTAVSFCEFGEKSDLKAIEKLLGKSLTVIDDHDWPMQVFEAAPKETRGNARRQQAQPRQQKRPATAPQPRTAKPATSQQPRAAKPATAQQPRTAMPATAPQPRTAKQTAPPKPRAAKPAPAPQKRTGETTSAPQHRGNDAAAPTHVQKVDLSRAFAGDKLMDATSRMLAGGRKANPTAAKPAGRKPQDAAPSGAKQPTPAKQAPREKNPPKGQSKAVQPPSKPQGQPAAKPPARPARQKFRDRRGPMAVELRPSNQKDSTEQNTLMRPYYLTPGE